MAVATLSAPVSMTAEQYHRISEHMEAVGTGPPPGRRFHACFGHSDHLIVFDVWDSVEQFDAFTATLMPILAVEHIEMAPPEPLEIHDLIDGGDSRALRRTIANFATTPSSSAQSRSSTASPGSPPHHQGTDHEPTARHDSPPEPGRPVT